MRVFITGATGFIGSAIVKELLKSGHQVTGLARSDAAANSLAAAGVKVHRGDLDDLDSLRRGAAECDGVIHTAFNHDFSKFKENCEVDRRAIVALGSAIAGSDRPLVVTSGTMILTPGKLATEEERVSSASTSIPRIATEEAAEFVAQKGVRVSIVRLPPTVHGDSDPGFISLMIKLAREKGVSAYVGEGRNCWAAIHRDDAAILYRLVLEKHTTAGIRYHGVAEESIEFRDIAGTIGKYLDIPVTSKSHDEAINHFGWFNFFATLDCPASSKFTQEALEWNPVQPTLLKDLETGNYFKE